MDEASFLLRFDLPEHEVWVEANGETCYAYLDRRGEGCIGDCWLFNLIEAPEEFRPARGETPVLDRHNARPFDRGSVDPEAFLVTGGEYEGEWTYEIWYGNDIIGVLAPGMGASQSAFATAASGLVQPLDRRAALIRHCQRTEFHLRQVLEAEAGLIPEAAAGTIRECLDANELGLATDDLREFEGSFSEAGRAAMAQIRVARAIRE